MTFAAEEDENEHSGLFSRVPLSIIVDIIQVLANLSSLQDCRPQLARAGLLTALVPLAAGHSHSILMLARQQALQGVDVPSMPEPDPAQLTGAAKRRREELRRRSERSLKREAQDGDDSDGGGSSDGGSGSDSDSDGAESVTNTDANDLDALVGGSTSGDADSSDVQQPSSDHNADHTPSPKRQLSLSERKMQALHGEVHIKKGVNALLQSPSVLKYLETHQKQAAAAASSPKKSPRAKSTTKDSSTGAGGSSAAASASSRSLVKRAQQQAAQPPKRREDIAAMMRRRDEGIRHRRAIVERAKEARRQTAIALCNMACDQANHGELMRLGAMPAWIDLCQPSAYVACVLCVALLVWVAQQHLRYPGVCALCVRPTGVTRMTPCASVLRRHSTFCHWT